MCALGYVQFIQTKKPLRNNDLESLPRLLEVDQDHQSVHHRPLLYNHSQLNQ